jgi:DNA-binding CsgD family transcriptional regulator
VVCGAWVPSGGGSATPRPRRSLASRLLAGHWPGLQLGGQAATVHELLAGFPADAAATDAELAVLIAADELAQGSLEAAERYLGVAARGGAAAVPVGRREQLQVLHVLVRALDLAEPEGLLLFFLLQPAPGLLERHARHRTAHPSLIAEILDLLTGTRPAPPAGLQAPPEPLSSSEIRVLRYLPTNLSQPEIANELHVSRNTIRTHMSHLYAKLGTHSRTEAVHRARALGLLAPHATRR